MTLGLTLAVVAAAWLGTTTGVAALLSSAVPLRHRREALQAARRAPALATPVRSTPVRIPTSQTTGLATRHHTPVEDDDSRDR